MVRRLLSYMRDRKRADLADVYSAVWGRDYALAGRGAIPTAVSKANSFLAKVGWPHHLHKVHGEPELRWE
jgi:hypothetical protein